jgi:hypothetical protein
MTVETQRPIAHDEAKQIAHRFINKHFNNHRQDGTTDWPRITIPADTERDDDLLLISYIEQQRAIDGGTPAARDVLAERERHKTAEGWTSEHDDEHTDGSMALAAAAYAVHFRHGAGRLWPWAAKWWKPRSHRENLVRAAALILAEIERLDRAAAGTLATAAEKV